MYVIATKHRDGNRAYAASSHSSLLYYTEDPADEDAWVGLALDGTSGINLPVPAVGAPPSDGKFVDWTAQ